MRVPLNDPVREYQELRDEIDAAIIEVAGSGRYILGERVERFEQEIARYVGTSHAVGVGSGTDALRLTLQALGIGPGDEVITTPFSFIATATTILDVGARPVFADIEPATFNLDPRAAAAAVTPATAALMPVHLFGQMADVTAFDELAARQGIALVEDAAQAIGAARPLSSGADSPPASGSSPAIEVRAGAAGVAGCFSFYPTKNLSALGDGGLVTTDDAGLTARLRSLSDHGRRPGGGHAEIGTTSRLDPLQAAILAVKLPRLDSWNERRRANAAAYDEVLAAIDGVTAPVVGEGNRHVFHQYTVRCTERAEVIRRLEAAEVSYGLYYGEALHETEALADLGYRAGAFPEAERAAREVLSLPVFPHLKEEEQERVIAVLGSP